MTAEELIRELPKGLIRWYPFEAGSRALYITGDAKLDHSLEEALTECGLCVECTDMAQLSGRNAGEYSYILAAGAVEGCRTQEELASNLKNMWTLLRKDGILLLITDNRLAVRYFCGDQDPFTGRNFDGVEDYKRISVAGGAPPVGRLYAKAELSCALTKAGFPRHRFYSVFPEITCPQALFAENFTPDEELGIRIFPQYHSPNTVFLEEENLYTSLIQNGMFHTMANGYLIECPLDGPYSEAAQVTVSMERGREDALCTLIRQDGWVIKKPFYEEGSHKPKRLYENNRYLQQHGVRMIDAKIEKGSLIMPYVQGVPLVSYFRSLLEQDRTEFFCRFDELWDLILHSSDPRTYDEVVWENFNPWWEEEKDERKRRKIDRSRWRRVAYGSEEDRNQLGMVLERGYIDLVLLNGFYIDGEYVFFDQESYVKDLPAKAILLRNIDLLYHGDGRIETLLPKRELLERYQIETYKEIYQAHIRHFLTRLRNDDVLWDYHRMRRRNNEIVHSNRQRMNYSAEEYQRLFVDIFKNTDKKKLYLFGSGNFARKFLALYQEDYTIEGILDNDETKWGADMHGITIMGAHVLKGLDPSAYKVIICIKNYVEVLRQLRKLGASNIGIYDTNMEYARERRMAAGLSVPEGQKEKKYRVGYVAGVFDLFHIGHLNLLRRAKEQCDHLIVGVVTDEGVHRDKGTDSFIPFEERMAVVAACRYVDEAVGIPLEFCDTKDAYLRFQFDAQFSGSDYAQDPSWLKKQEFLRAHGAQLVFFPYTESTSSTQLKEMIGRKLV